MGGQDADESGVEELDHEGIGEHLVSGQNTARDWIAHDDTLRRRRTGCVSYS
jgi:hypothetical protein